MTVTRESPSAIRDSDALTWAERSTFTSLRGISWWVAILVAVLPTVLGGVMDMLLWNAPGSLTMCVYGLSCAAAITFVRRDSVFGPAVQPPLILALILPLLVLAFGQFPAAGGSTAKAIAVANPLISAFPMMALTSAITVLLGMLRIFYLQPAEDADLTERPRTRGRDNRTARPSRGSARGEARRPSRDSRGARDGRTSAGRPRESADTKSARTESRSRATSANAKSGGSKRAGAERTRIANSRHPEPGRESRATSDGAARRSPRSGQPAQNNGSAAGSGKKPVPPQRQNGQPSPNGQARERRRTNPERR